MIFFFTTTKIKVTTLMVSAKLAKCVWSKCGQNNTKKTESWSTAATQGLFKSIYLSFFLGILNSHFQINRYVQTDMTKQHGPLTPYEGALNVLYPAFAKNIEGETGKFFKNQKEQPMIP